MLMMNIMSSFKITNYVSNGFINKSFQCSGCKNKIPVTTLMKLNKEKITTVRCTKCGLVYKIGDIYNFKSGNKLNHRLNNTNQSTFDKHEWLV